MDSLIFEIQILFYFQLFLSADVRHNRTHPLFRGFPYPRMLRSRLFPCSGRQQPSVQAFRFWIFLSFSLVSLALVTSGQEGKFI